MMATGARCVVRDVTKQYGAQRGVRDVSLEVGAGEVVGVAGPNGAGKSTIARLLLGFAQPDAGQVTIGNMPAHEFRQQFGVGYLPEEAKPGWRCTVGQLLALRTGSASEALRPLAIAEELGVTPWLNRRISKLSKGQWRMALLCYALSGSSPLIILDEPDSGLDPDALDRLQTGIGVAARHGSTVFVLSHNLDELERACSRFLFVFDGRIVADLTRDEVRQESARETYRRLSRG